MLHGKLRKWKYNKSFCVNYVKTSFFRCFQTRSKALSDVVWPASNCRTEFAKSDREEKKPKCFWVMQTPERREKNEKFEQKKQLEKLFGWRHMWVITTTLISCDKFSRPKNRKITQPSCVRCRCHLHCSFSAQLSSKSRAWKKHWIKDYREKRKIDSNLRCVCMWMRARDKEAVLSGLGKLLASRHKFVQL